MPRGVSQVTEMKIKVGVFFGGKSVEHEISIISAIQAIGDLDTEKYDIIPIYITKNNEFYVGDAVGEIESYKNIPALLKNSQRVIIFPDGGRAKLLRYPVKKFSENVIGTIDIAFPIVHGTNVEDGTLQGYLSMLGVPYVGCDVTSSAVGMDKYVMKTVLKDNGVPVLDCRCYTGCRFDRERDEIIAEIESCASYPVIVKPVNLGSSIGINLAHDRQELIFALETAFCYAEKVLVEKAITELKEINCSVLGDEDEAIASECEEPLSSGEILDFNQKYIGDSSSGGGAKGAKGGLSKLGGAKASGGSKGMATLKRKIPADITPQQRERVRTLAVKAFRCMGCSGVSRLDFMLDMASGEIYLNEINTIPGSLAFYLWEATGMKYSELLDRMIGLARKRARLQQSITYTFDSNVLEGVSFGGAKGTKGAKGAKR